MKKILYSVLGLSPQILTETLYALLHEKPAFIPDEIHILTTKKGAKHCQLALFKDEGGWFHKLCQDYNLQGVQFTNNNIHIITDANGHVLDDIRSKEDNTAVANLITQQIRKFTSDKNTMLHVSIAGGRKTMGFYAGYALSIFGREHDQLSHVLVESHFESHHKFFYPTPYPSILSSKDGNEFYDKKDAKVSLAYMPFISMRSSLPERFLQENISFEKMVGFLQKQVFDSMITICASNLTITINNELIKLSPINFAFYYWIAERLINGDGAISIPFDSDPSGQYSEEFILCANRVLDLAVDNDRSYEALKVGMDKDFIRDRKAYIKKAITNVLGENGLAYCLQTIDKKEKTLGFLFKKNLINFVY